MYVDTFLFLYIHIRIPFNQATYIDKEVSLVLYMGVPTPWCHVKPAGPEVVISNVEGQVIEGFGGAFTESSAAVYKTTEGGGGQWMLDIRVDRVTSEKVTGFKADPES